MIKFIKNRDLIWDVEKYDVILVGCSIYNLLTQGFQAKLCVKYPGLKAVDGKTPYADKRKYGTRVSYDVNGQTLSLMYICGYPYKNKDNYFKILLSCFVMISTAELTSALVFICFSTLSTACITVV